MAKLNEEVEQKAPGGEDGLFISWLELYWTPWNDVLF